MSAVHSPVCAWSGATRPWVGQFHFPQQQLLLADACEPQVPIALLGNILPGCTELCAHLAGPHSDFLELQEAGQVLW